MSLKDDIGQLPEFSSAVFGSLAHEALTDPELLVLAISGLALASRSRPLKGIGIGLVGWYVTRKADTYMQVIDSKIGALVTVIGVGNSFKEANGNQT